jgi:hypothetical protein
LTVFTVSAVGVLAKPNSKTQNNPKKQERKQTEKLLGFSFVLAGLWAISKTLPKLLRR